MATDRVGEPDAAAPVERGPAGGMTLTRMGHYHLPTGAEEGICQTAVVVFANVEDVNVVTWSREGVDQRRVGVPVADPRVIRARATFHLSRDCPWGR